MRARAVIALTKPRLCTLSVITAFVGYVGARPAWNPRATFALIVGTSLAAAGALALNQWRERDTDCMMRRTRDRPLPQQQLSPRAALAWSLGLAFTGPTLLALAVGPLAAAIAVATIVLYAAAYTPLKRRTRWATEIGAVPGALPPLLGWAAAQNTIPEPGWWLFALLFCWQMPHFFAIGWLCRTDYRAAGMPLLPAIDTSGQRTARWSLVWCVALTGVSVAPWWRGHVGLVYAITAFLAGVTFTVAAVRFVRANDNATRDRAARHLFFASLFHLPVVLLALALDRLLVA